MKYRWSIAPAQPALAEFLARELRISPLLAQCLLNRGLSEARGDIVALTDDDVVPARDWLPLIVEVQMTASCVSSALTMTTSG